jgi:hypothetical protein
LLKRLINNKSFQFFLQKHTFNLSGNNYLKMNSISVNINLSFEQLIAAVKQLSSKEKLLLNDVLWEENIEIPREHQAMVLSRIQKAEQNSDRLVDWDKASKSLKP